MNHIIMNQLNIIEQKEKKSCQMKEKGNRIPFRDKLEEKIPEGLEEKLNKAFYLGFKAVFKKGSGMIEKTYDKEKRKQDYDIKDFAFERRKNTKALRQVNLQSGLIKLENLGLTALEGTALGLLGVGIPDIPLFIGMMLKSVYEIAMSYGYSYESEEEQFYILLLLEASLSEGEERRRKMVRIDEVAGKLSQDIVEALELDEQMKKTAQGLADNMLYAKFIQGIPVVGAIGGVTNIFCLNRIVELAGWKYQKRYLLEKLKQ